MLLNLIKVIISAVDYHRLISWAFHNNKKKSKFTKNWDYPVIQSMSGSGKFLREYENGYCHLKVSGYSGKHAYIFISNNTGTERIKNPENENGFIENPNAKLVFRIDKVINNDWNRLTHIIFVFNRNNEKNIAIIDWNDNKIREVAKSIKEDKKYIIFRAKDFEVVKESEVPEDYKPVCYYEKLGFKAITQNYVGAHKKKVKVINYAEGVEWIFNSHKEACEEIIKSGNWNLKDYNSYKTMKSSGKKLKSKDKTKLLSWTNNLDGYEMIEVNLCNIENNTKIKNINNTTNNNYKFITKVNQNHIASNESAVADFDYQSDWDRICKINKKSAVPNAA